MPFELENGTDYIGLEVADQLWLENDILAGGIKWPRCCCVSVTCSQTFHIIGCISRSLPGATVSVYVSNGGALLGQSTTGTGGTVTLSWTGSCSVYVTVTATGFVSYGQSLTLSTGSTTTITLSAATGYHCDSICGCSAPIPLTLQLTDSVIGSLVLTYNGSTNQWECNTTYNYAGYTAPSPCNITCGAVSDLPISYSFSGTQCVLSMNLGSTGLSVPGCCPWLTSGSCISPQTITGTIDCPESGAFLWSGSHNYSGTCDPLSYLYSQGAVTYTVTV